MISLDSNILLDYLHVSYLAFKLSAPGFTLFPVLLKAIQEILFPALLFPVLL